MVILNLLRHGFGAYDVAALGGFVACAEQKDDRLSALRKVDALAGALVDAQLSDPVKVFHITHFGRFGPA